MSNICLTLMVELERLESDVNTLLSIPTDKYQDKEVILELTKITIDTIKHRCDCISYCISQLYKHKDQLTQTKEDESISGEDIVVGLVSKLVLKFVLKLILSGNESLESTVQALDKLRGGDGVENDIDALLEIANKIKENE